MDTEELNIFRYNPNTQVLGILKSAVTAVNLNRCPPSKQTVTFSDPSFTPCGLFIGVFEP